MNVSSFKFQVSRKRYQQMLFVLLVAVVALTVFLRLYNLEKRFYFEWDQERDAYVVYDLLVKHEPTLIGPLQTAEGYGFFLGPWYYYVLAPFYFFTRYDPIAAGIFSATVSLTIAAVTILLFLLFWQLRLSYLKKASLLFGLLLVTIFMLPDWRTRYAFNAALIPVTSGLLLSTLLCLIERKEKLVKQHKLLLIISNPAYGIPAAWLLLGLSIHFHFSGIFLCVPLMYVLWHLRKEVGFVKHMIIGIALFVVTFLPLVLFDIRHQFLNSQLFYRFFFGGGETTSLGFDWRRPIAGILEIHDFIYRTFGYWKAFAQGLFLIILLTGFWHLPKREHKILIALCVVPVMLLFAFYRTFQSYYLLFLTPLVVSLYVYGLFYYITSFRSIKFVLPIFLLWYVFTSTRAVKDDTFDTSLYQKRQAVMYIINQKQDPIFNVSYQTWPGHNKGFDYLFTYYKKRPVDAAEGHLYTITLPYGYDKEATYSAKFGNIGVIRR